MCVIYMYMYFFPINLAHECMVNFPKQCPAHIILVLSILHWFLIAYKIKYTNLDLKFKALINISLSQLAS